MKESVGARLRAVAPGAYLGRDLSDEEWKAIQEIAAENGHVDDGFGEGIHCEYCDAEIRYERCDQPEDSDGIPSGPGCLSDWYEGGLLTKPCVSKEDREWVCAAFAKVDATIRETIAQARQRGLSDATIEWAIDKVGLDPELIKRDE